MSDNQYNGYQIKHLGTFPMVEIKAVGQGRVPNQLLGLYTTVSLAQKAIDAYVDTKAKGKQDGKAKGSGPS